MQLYHFNDGSRNIWTAVTANNVARFIEAEGLNTESSETAHTALQNKIVRAEKFYPEQWKFNDADWAAYQAALNAAKAALDSTSASEMLAAGDALVRAEKDMRFDNSALTELLNRFSRLTESRYTQESYAAAKTAADTANAALARGAQQIKLDKCKTELQQAMNALQENAVKPAESTVDVTPETSEEEGHTVLTYDLTGKRIGLVKATVNVGTKVYADGVLIAAPEQDGDLELPVAGVKTLRFVGTENCVKNVQLIRYTDEVNAVRGIYINGMELSGFRSNVKFYSYELEPGAKAPVVTVRTSDGITADVTQPTAVPGNAVITIQSDTGKQETYTICFTYRASATEDHPSKIVYLSDIDKAKWTHNLCGYGRDTDYNGGTKGYDTCYTGSGGFYIPLTNSKQAKFSKGIVFEGVDHKPNGANATNNDGCKANKDAIVATDGLANYSRIKYNIAGEGYQVFRGTVGLSNGRFNHDKTDGTLRFYADDELLAQYPFKGGMEAFDVELNIEGAETFSIQIDPENVNGVPGALADNWCWGDIICIGNARFESTGNSVYVSDIDQKDALGNEKWTHDIKFYGRDRGYSSGSKVNIAYGAGKTDYKTFPKGISMEATDHMIPKDGKQGANGSEGDDVYKKNTVENYGLENYSRIRYSIAGDGYIRFRGTVGLSEGRFDHDKTDGTLRFYADNKLLAEYPFKGGLAPFEVDFGITDAKTFTIQIDPENVNGVAGAVADNWCWGDIIYIGDARFVKASKQLVSIDHAHDYQLMTTTSPATCTENGSGTYTCSTCQNTVTGIIPALGHNMTHHAEEPATCTTDGTKEYYSCDRCNKNFADKTGTQELNDLTIEKIGHELTYYARVEPTHKTEGHVEYWHCGRCGKYFADASGNTELTGSRVLPRLAYSGSNQISTSISTRPVKFPFTDVVSGSWYETGVRSAWEKGLINGVTATQFQPDGQLTTAQTIKLAAVLHQLRRNDRVTLTNGSPWYTTYLEYAVSNDVIESEYRDRTEAELNAPVTRGEFVHILHGAMSSYLAINTVTDGAIPDVDAKDTYSAEIYEFYRAGILTGSDAAGTFHAENTIQRSEAAVILNRMFDASSRQRLTLR